MVGRTIQLGNIFNFDKESYNPIWLYIAQAGGWMYPVWAVSTALPLYIGLEDAGFWGSTVPCALVAYGMCIMGGSLHSAFAFVTVIPTSYHYSPADGDAGQLELLNHAQSKILEHIGIGSLVGYLSLNLAFAWIAIIVATRQNIVKFPKWFNLFNPFVTMVWVSVSSYLFLPDTLSFYCICSMGTWVILFINIGTMVVLRADRTYLCLHKDTYEHIKMT